MRTIHHVLVLALALGVAAAGCASSEADAQAGPVLGPAKAPDSYATTTLSELAQNDNWKGKPAIFDGTISKVGCQGCGGVILAEKTWRLSCEPSDPSKFKIPVKTGALVRVWGKLTVGEDGFREVKADRVEFLSKENKS